MILLYLLVGIVSGLIGGLLGIGGGSIIVPSLVYIFSYLCFPRETIMHVAIGTSLAATAINSLLSAYLHSRSQGVSWGFLRKILPGIFFGALFGSFIAILLSTRWLEILFAFFAFGIALRFFRLPIKKTSFSTSLSSLQIALVGLVTGIISNLVGVGGGIFMIPLLTFSRFPSEKIFGTSASVSFLISLFGISFFLLKEGFSCIHFPSLLWITIGGLCSVRYGAHLTKVLPYKTISKVFATLMLLTGLLMLFGR